MILQTIDFKALERHEYTVSPNFSIELKQIDQEKKSLKGQMEYIQHDITDELELSEKDVKLQDANNLGYHFRVSRKNEKYLRKDKKKYITLEMRKDGIRFTTKEMSKISKLYQNNCRQYNKISRGIIAKCIEITKTYLPLFEQLSLLLANIDVYNTFAHISTTAIKEYTRPILKPLRFNNNKDNVDNNNDDDDIIFKLIESRHPILEALEGSNFIANDLLLQYNKSQVQIITGPNMGGKSTYIRQVGVIILLAQIGCYIPCNNGSIITIQDAILARIGAGDVQLKGVSTFMQEMLEASTILQHATKNSLLIIDELGRGTSTYDGFGLAWAIAEYISTNIQASCLFATHFHELTQLAQNNPNIINKHVTALASEDDIVMLYKIKEGICDRSFGIHVAQVAQFPKQVIESAKKKAQELEDFGNQAEVIFNEEKQEKEIPLGTKNTNDDVIMN